MAKNVEIKWNPNLERDVLREIQKNVTPKLEQAMRQVRCPEHGESPRVVPDGKGWRVESTCCERVKPLAEAALAKALK